MLSGSKPQVSAGGKPPPPPTSAQRSLCPRPGVSFPPRPGPDALQAGVPPATPPPCASCGPSRPRPLPRDLRVLRAPRDPGPFSPAARASPDPPAGTTSLEGSRAGGRKPRPPCGPRVCPLGTLPLRDFGSPRVGATGRRPESRGAGQSRDDARARRGAEMARRGGLTQDSRALLLRNPGSSGRPPGVSGGGLGHAAQGLATLSAAFPGSPRKRTSLRCARQTPPRPVPPDARYLCPDFRPVTPQVAGLPAPQAAARLMLLGRGPGRSAGPGLRVAPWRGEAEVPATIRVRR